MTAYLLTLDQSTSATKAALMDAQGNLISEAALPHQQHYPAPGWVEHDPLEIFAHALQVLRQVVRQSGVDLCDIAGLGITNQRETTVVWDRASGLPVYPAIVWQCRRTADLCAEFASSGCEPLLRAKTGLLLDPYFSATKLLWILNHVEGVRQRAEKGEVLFGTIDSWLIWKLTGGLVHATDMTNASRTLLFNIHSLRWDPELLELFAIPERILPEVHPSGARFGRIANEFAGLGGLPIVAAMGDSQAALFGQRCFGVGQTKATYGTGTSVLMNTGTAARQPTDGLVTSLAWKWRDQVVYAQECIIHSTGDTLQWLKDSLHLFAEFRELDDLLASVADNEGVYIVPAFSGLGAPYWDAQARAAIVGMTRGTHRGHLVRAAFEAAAYQVADAVELMTRRTGVAVSDLRADGGLTQNPSFMQFQADVLGTVVKRSLMKDLSSVGVGYMAGLSAGVWTDLADIRNLFVQYDDYCPTMSSDAVDRYRAQWHGAVRKTLVEKA